MIDTAEFADLMQQWNEAYNAVRDGLRPYAVVPCRTDVVGNHAAYSRCLTCHSALPDVHVMLLWRETGLSFTPFPLSLEPQPGKEGIYYRDFCSEECAIKEVTSCGLA